MNIGAHSIVGAGSVVVKDISPGVIAYGNPCRMRASLGDERFGSVYGVKHQGPEDGAFL